MRLNEKIQNEMISMEFSHSVFSISDIIVNNELFT